MGRGNQGLFYFLTRHCHLGNRGPFQPSTLHFWVLQTQRFFHLSIAASHSELDLCVAPELEPDCTLAQNGCRPFWCFYSVEFL